MSIPPIISQKNKSAKDSLIHWKSENPKAYSDFICQIEQAKDGDYSAYIRIFETAIECIPQEVIDECDGCLEIPQFGTKHSLNVSTTAGIIIWKFAEAAL